MNWPILIGALLLVLATTATANPFSRRAPDPQPTQLSSLDDVTTPTLVRPPVPVFTNDPVVRGVSGLAVALQIGATIAIYHDGDEIPGASSRVILRMQPNAILAIDQFGRQVWGAPK